MANQVAKRRKFAKCIPHVDISNSSLQISLIVFFLSSFLVGCEGTREAMIGLEKRHQEGKATSQVDFYEVEASVFAGEEFEALKKGQRHRLEQVGPNLYAMTEVYTASTSDDRAKAIAKLGVAMHARQSGFGFVFYDQVMLRVICAYKFGVLEIRSHPITFTRARFSKKSEKGFENVNNVLSRSAQFMTDAPRQEKIDAQLHWVEQCLIINTRDPSALAPTDYDYSLSTKPPPNFKY